jgi:hypothetical protein
MTSAMATGLRRFASEMRRQKLHQSIAAYRG